MIKKIRINGVDYDIGEISLGDNVEYDFSIADEQGNTILAIKNGNIVSKHPVSAFSLEISMEGGAINTGLESYDIESYEKHSRSSFFIKTNGAKKIITPIAVMVWQYNDTHRLISVDNPSTANSLNEDCCYVRISVNNKKINRLNTVFIGGCPEETFKVAQRTEVGSGVTSTDRSEKITFKVDESICTTARLMLPPNYTTDGKKVPLIIWDSGDGDFVSWNKEIGYSYEKRINGLKWCRDMGFAILEIYSWGSYYYKKYPSNNRAAMPIPTHLRTHEAGVKYVTEHYNVDGNNIFHLSKSGSGKLALHYAQSAPKFGLRAIYAMAPVFDDLTFRSWGNAGYRGCLYEDLNLTGTDEQLRDFLQGTPIEDGGNGTSWYFCRPPSDGNVTEAYTAMIARNQTFIKNNASKFSSVSVSWRNLIGQQIEDKVEDTFEWANIFWDNQDSNGNFYPGDPTLENRCYNRYDLSMVGSGIPFKVIMAENDEQTPFWSCNSVVAQLLNAGNDATIVKTVPLGHSAPDMGKTELRDTLYGGSYEVSEGWFMAIKDIMIRFLNQRENVENL